MVRDFARKLRITAALLGCASQKDLCARFRTVNPRTAFALDRSYKWMQGRALPRTAAVYADWAVLLDVGRPVAWLAACSVDEFLDLVCGRHEVSRAALVGPLERGADGAAPPARDTGARALPIGGYLAGAYGCYSHAWSPHFRGKIVRGALTIEPAGANAAPGLAATYSQSIPFGRLTVQGPVALTSRSIYLDLSEPAHRRRVSMCLFLPAPPASVLAGVMMGTPAIDSEAQPAATRVVMVRIPAADAAAALEDSNRYLALAAEPLSGDLAAHGVVAGRRSAAELDALLECFLTGAGEPGTHIQVAAAEYARLALAFDRLLIDNHRLGRE